MSCLVRGTGGIPVWRVFDVDGHRSIRSCSSARPQQRQDDDGRRGYRGGGHPDRKYYTVIATTRTFGAFSDDSVTFYFEFRLRAAAVYSVAIFRLRRLLRPRCFCRRFERDEDPIHVSTRCRVCDSEVRVTSRRNLFIRRRVSTTKKRNVIV